MEKTTLGRGGPEVSRVGLGLMGMSGIYGPGRRAGEPGHHPGRARRRDQPAGHRRLLRDGAKRAAAVARLREVPADSVFVQVKFGGQRDPSGRFIGHDASPAAVKNSLAYTLTRLGTDHVDLYQPARLDPHVPIEDTVGAIVEMIEAGYVRYLGLSEVGAETIRRAHAVYPVRELQIEYSLMSRGIEAEILPAVRELGISVTAYGVMSRGLLNRDTARIAEGDPRARFPRFQDEQPGTQPRAAGRAGEDRGAPRGEHRPAGHRLGGVPGRGHHPADRDQAAGPAGRGAGRARPAPDPARSWPRSRPPYPPEQVAGTRYDAAQMGALDSERRPGRVIPEAHRRRAARLASLGTAPCAGPPPRRRRPAARR